MRFVEHGICVEAGMIVGLDGDDARIFERQFEFSQRCPVPVFTLSALYAPAATPLFARLKKDGRLSEEDDVASQAPGPWKTNVIPLGMSGDELRQALRN